MKTSYSLKTSAALCLIIIVIVSPVSAEEKPAVAVMDFAASNAPATEASIMADFVRSAVVRSGKFKVVDKKNMETILAEQAFQQTGCTSSECAVKLGKLLNVQKMVVGNYGMLGGIRYMSANLVKVETGEIERSGQVKDIDPRNVDRAADELVSQLTGEVVASVGAPKSIEVRPFCIYLAGFVGTATTRGSSTKTYAGTKGGINYSYAIENSGEDEESDASGFQLGGRYYIKEWLMVDASAIIINGFAFRGYYKVKAPASDNSGSGGNVEVTPGVSSGITLNYVKPIGKKFSAFGGVGAQYSSFKLNMAGDDQSLNANFSSGTKSVYYMFHIASGEEFSYICPLAQLGAEYKLSERLGLSVVGQWRPQYSRYISGQVKGEYTDNSAPPAQTITEEDANILHLVLPGFTGMATLGYYF